MSEAKRVGTIGWFDLTIPDADRARDFYRDVVGWTASEFDMGGYRDYCMHPPGAEEPIAGVCHARGQNVGLPAQWLMYITVADLAASLAKCKELGGKVVCEPRSMGSYGTMAVIQDPAGAVCALIESGN